MKPSANPSLRRTLLVGILAPVLLFEILGATLLYRSALSEAHIAYDRTLLASAKAIGEQLSVIMVARAGGPAVPQVKASLPYSALEAFEVDNRSRLYYRVQGFAQETVSGFADLPAARTAGTGTGPYAALVHFYDEQYGNQPVRMAVLLQPVADAQGLGMATIQVAETLELRQEMAQRLLQRTLLQQSLLLPLIALAVAYLVHRATLPVRKLSQAMQARAPDQLQALPTHESPRELQPLVQATNRLMARLTDLLEHQKRFVRDASHQLRTPLAVLKAQVQSARRGDLPADLALVEIDNTVARATDLANQMLALAKLEQLRHQGPPAVCDWAPLVRAVAMDLAPLVAAKQLDFEVQTQPCPVQAHEWALRELVRNVLHNAIKFSPTGGPLLIMLGHSKQWQAACEEPHATASDGAPAMATGVTSETGFAVLSIIDSGPGLDSAQRQHLFEPFAVGPDRPDAAGSGLGLTICKEIVQGLGGLIALTNQEQSGKAVGLRVQIHLPLAAHSLATAT